MTTEGMVETEASIMDGCTLAGAGVAGLQRVQNPVTAARFTMEKVDELFYISNCLKSNRKLIIYMEATT